MTEQASIAVSSFLAKVVEKAGGNKKFSGTFDELVALTVEHFDNWTPGIGSEDGDVRIVKLPTAGFFTDIVEITESNASELKVRYDARVPGEAPVPQLYINSDEYAPASHVGVVIYHSSVLARDNSRSTDADWEIVAILANPTENVPMHPYTMARNSAHETGGTYREYSAAEWLEATSYWQRHAYLKTSPTV